MGLVHCGICSTCVLVPNYCLNCNDPLCGIHVCIWVIRPTWFLIDLLVSISSDGINLLIDSAYIHLCGECHFHWQNIGQIKLTLFCLLKYDTCCVIPHEVLVINLKLIADINKTNQFALRKSPQKTKKHSLIYHSTACGHLWWRYTLTKQGNGSLKWH